MQKRYKVLILGASYGSLLGTKISMAGHDVTMVCLPAEAELFNSVGAIVRMPVKGREGLVEINSRDLPGTLDAAGTGDVDPADFDLVALAMQEPQYGSPGVRELLGKVARSRVPCMSIMNMPPLPYLKRIPSLDGTPLEDAFTEASIWDDFDPKLMTLCSPDPQAFRPPEEGPNVLHVGLPTNFKVSKFHDAKLDAMLSELETGIQNFKVDGKDVPVKLRVFDSLFVPFAKWSMLATGNYRCITADGPRSIQDAVHGDLAKSKEIYNYVSDLVVRLGADIEDMVPFEKYANAAKSLLKPSSAARAVFSGAKNIERVDKLIQLAGKAVGMHHASIDETVATVDAKLAENRKAD